MLNQLILLGILDAPFSIAGLLVWFIIIFLIVLLIVRIVKKKLKGNPGNRDISSRPNVGDSSSEGNVNIAGGWSGNVAEPKVTPSANYGPAKKGRIILRGVVQIGGFGMRIQVYDNEHFKQVEVKAGRWARGVRNGDIIHLLGNWRNESYVEAYRIHNETTGVDFKPSALLPIIAIIVIVVILLLIVGDAIIR